jgi:hypothetical protein
LIQRFAPILSPLLLLSACSTFHGKGANREKTAECSRFDPRSLIGKDVGSYSRGTLSVSMLIGHRQFPPPQPPRYAIDQFSVCGNGVITLSRASEASGRATIVDVMPSPRTGKTRRLVFGNCLAAGTADDELFGVVDVHSGRLIRLWRANRSKQGFEKADSQGVDCAPLDDGDD